MVVPAVVSMTSLGRRVGELMGSISEGGAMVLRDGSAKVHLPRSRVGTEGGVARASSSGEEKNNGIIKF